MPGATDADVRAFEKSFAGRVIRAARDADYDGKWLPRRVSGDILSRPAL